MQFKQTRGYLSTTCGFPALKDRVVIIIDASDLTFDAHNEIWKGDREHVRETILGERYKDAVTAAIKESKALQDLQNEVAIEELQQAAKSERNDLFQKLVNSDRNLAALLTNRDPVITLPSAGGGGNGSDHGQGEFVGKFSPTRLKFEDKVREKDFDLPINRTRPLIARTDVENGYLQRSDNKGRLIVDQGVNNRFGIRAQLYNGRLTLYLDPTEDAKVGDRIALTVGLQDDAMPQPVIDSATVRIIEQDKQPKKKKKKTAEPKGAAKGSQEGEGESAPTHGLPPFVLLTKHGHKVGDDDTQPWPPGFTEVDGGLIEDLGNNGVLYKINYDNVYHIKYRVTARGDIARGVVTEKYILGMRILMLGYEHALRTIRELKGDLSSGMSEFQDDFRRMAARGAAATVLALAENLPKIVDKSSLNTNQDVE